MELTKRRLFLTVQLGIPLATHKNTWEQHSIAVPFYDLPHLAIAEGIDVITDFNPAQGDKLQISGHEYQVFDAESIENFYDPTNGYLYAGGTLFVTLTNQPATIRGSVETI